MVMHKAPPRLATQTQVYKPKLAGKVMKQKIIPKLIDGRTTSMAGEVMTQKITPKQIDDRTSTLFKKGKELATLCDAQLAVLVYGSNGSVQTWPNDSNTVKDILLKYKQVSEKKALKSMKNKVADYTTGEGLCQNPLFEDLSDDMVFELLDEECEKLSRDSLMGLTDFFESNEQNPDEAISLNEVYSQTIEGSQSIDHTENNNNCDLPIELSGIWEDLMSENFDEGQTLLSDSVLPWQACLYNGFESFDSSGIETSTNNSLAYQNTPNGIGNSTISNTDSCDEQLGFSQASGDFESYSSSFGTGIWNSTCSSLDHHHNTYYPDFSTFIRDGSSSTNLQELGQDQCGMLQANGGFSSDSDELLTKNNASLEDFELWYNDMITRSEQHQICASAASTSGYSTPTSSHPRDGGQIR